MQKLGGGGREEKINTFNPETPPGSLFLTLRQAQSSSLPERGLPSALRKLPEGLQPTLPPHLPAAPGEQRCSVCPGAPDKRRGCRHFPALLPRSIAPSRRQIPLRQPPVAQHPRNPPAGHSFPSPPAMLNHGGRPLRRVSPGVAACPPLPQEEVSRPPLPHPDLTCRGAGGRSWSAPVLAGGTCSVSREARSRAGRPRAAASAPGTGGRRSGRLRRGAGTNHSLRGGTAGGPAARRGGEERAGPPTQVRGEDCARGAEGGVGGARRAAAALPVRRCPPSARGGAARAVSLPEDASGPGGRAGSARAGPRPPGGAGLGSPQAGGGRLPSAPPSRGTRGRLRLQEAPQEPCGAPPGRGTPRAPLARPAVRRGEPPRAPAGPGRVQAGGAAGGSLRAARHLPDPHIRAPCPRLRTVFFLFSFGPIAKCFPPVCTAAVCRSERTIS